MMPDRFRLSTALISAGLLMSACNTSTMVGRREQGVALPSEITKSSELTEYGRSAATIYLDVANDVAVGQDIAAVSVLGLAAAGVVAGVNGLSGEAITKIGIAGLTVGAANRYFDPEGDIEALIAAASQHLCLATVADGRSSLSKEQIETIVQGFNQSRIALRTALARSVPNYTDLVNQLAGSNDAARKFRADADDLTDQVLACLGLREAK